MNKHQITVTQAMLDAGVEETKRAGLVTAHGDDESREQLCADIFRAMLTKGEVVCLPDQQETTKEV